MDQRLLIGKVVVLKIPADLEEAIPEELEQQTPGLLQEAVVTAVSEEAIRLDWNGTATLCTCPTIYDPGGKCDIVRIKRAALFGEVFDVPTYWYAGGATCNI